MALVLYAFHNDDLRIAYDDLLKTFCVIDKHWSVIRHDFKTANDAIAYKAEIERGQNKSK